MITDIITVNTHSSVRIAGEKLIWVDPFGIEGNPADAEIIFITHSHFDHLSPEDIKKVIRPDTVIAAPVTIKEDLEKAGFGNVKSVFLRPGDSTEILGIPAEAVPAYNISKPFHPKENGWLGYVLTVFGKRIYIAGDTDATPEAKAVKCSVAMLPVGGKYTMDAREASWLAEAIGPEYAIPIHFGTVAGDKSAADSFGGRNFVTVRKLVF